MRTLVFGPMPEGATPAAFVASGTWCFTGREASFSGWDGPQGFPLPPDPYSVPALAAAAGSGGPLRDAGALDRAARAANGEALRLLTLWGGEANRQSGVHRSIAFWELALGPFLLLTAHMLSERQQRVLDLISLYGEEPLRVELLPAGVSFSFRNSVDFMVHGVQDRHFNHYVFSRLVEALAPAGWELSYLPAPVLHTAGAEPSPSLKTRVKNRLRTLLWAMPFPRQKGFSLWQSAILSFAVLLNKNPDPAPDIRFAEYCGSPVRWQFPAEDLIAACLPGALRGCFPQGVAELGALARSVREASGGINTVLPPLPAPPPAHGGLRAMLPLFSQSESYRLRLAAFREKGGRLFSIQHGANYGNLRNVGIIPFEYSRHAFFSWGWEAHSGVPGNIRPMNHPSPAAIANTHREAAAELILVGTEMSTYTYRLKSRPLARSLVDYRAAKVSFIRALGEDMLPHVRYRPYFAVAGGLDDAAFVQRHIPQAALCTGDLTEQMLRCRLLALDHYGTTMLMALAANVPVVAFWDSNQWGMTEDTEEAFAVLRHADILHDDAPAAAGHAVEIWDDVQGWWNTPEVQDARKFWLERFVRCLDDTGRPFSRGEITRRWFTALRNC